MVFNYQTPSRMRLGANLPLSRPSGDPYPGPFGESVGLQILVFLYLEVDLLVPYTPSVTFLISVGPIMFLSCVELTTTFLQNLRVAQLGWQEDSHLGVILP